MITELFGEMSTKDQMTLAVAHHPVILSRSEESLWRFHKHDGRKTGEEILHCGSG
jgi:hypothetical protein